MQLFLRDQRARLAQFLSIFETRPLSYTDGFRLREQTTRLVVPTQLPMDDLTACNVTFLRDYQIFPKRILVFAAQWQIEQRRMRPGDLIVQQVFLPPTRVSVKGVFAVRVLEVWSEPANVGFSYGTVEGHVERGISRFALQVSAGRLYAVIHTTSEPALLLSRVLGPLFTLPYQRYCTRKVVERMRDEFLRANPNAQVR